MSRTTIIPPQLHEPLRRLGVLVALGIIYFAAGKLGLRLALLHPSATPVWPPTGIALTAFLVLGARAWPAIFAGAFLVNVTTAGTVLTSLGIAAGNTLEGLLGAHLIERWAGGRRALESVRGVVQFVVFAALASTAVSATWGVTSLALGGFARWADYGPIWITWWLGDAAGALIVAPVLLLWTAQPRIQWAPARIVEAVAMLVATVFGALLVFGEPSPVAERNYALAYVCLPPLLWAAVRFGAREVSTAVLILSAIAIRGTLLGVGPFVRVTPNEALVLLQAFMAVMAVTGLILAAAVTDRRRVEEQLRRLSVRDPLTGLANYRHLLQVLEGEVRRADRTGRPFALLFLDVDGLKAINDRHGHVVGSEALVRLARVLQRSCRSVDTAARFGGDEFAVVLPETHEEAAWEAARRVSAQIAAEQAVPRLSASLGVAVYPRDGRTAAALLGSADRALYAVKGERRRQRRARVAGLDPLLERG